MSDALARVKAELGGGAVILHTRTIKRGGVLGLGARNVVEITATADPRVAARRKPPAQSPPPVEPRDEPAQRDQSSRDDGQSAPPEVAESAATATMVAGGAAPPQSASADPALREEMSAIRSMVQDLLQRRGGQSPAQVPAELIEFYTRLIGQEVAEEIVAELIRGVRGRLGDRRATYWDTQGRPVAAASMTPERIREELVHTIDEMLPPASPLELVDENRPTIVALVGPTGVGKTTTLAKLAAQMKLRENRRVGLITIDSYRIAAVEQLKTYAQILQVPLIPVVTAEDMADAVKRLADVDLILIDSAGRSQRDEPRIAELGRFLQIARPDQVHLVLSATSRESQLKEAVERFSAVGARRVIFTKLDEAVGFGVMLNILKTAGLRLSYLTAGQSVPDDIEAGSARRVAELILGTVHRGHGGESTPAGVGAAHHDGGE
jgi:flagellar biosynthesis protein FlhF